MKTTCMPQTRDEHPDLPFIRARYCSSVLVQLPEVKRSWNSQLSQIVAGRPGPHHQRWTFCRTRGVAELPDPEHSLVGAQIRLLTGGDAPEAVMLQSPWPGGLCGTAAMATRGHSSFEFVEPLMCPLPERRFLDEPEASALAVALSYFRPAPLAAC
jgi:hypothetical protein